MLGDHMGIRGAVLLIFFAIFSRDIFQVQSGHVTTAFGGRGFTSANARTWRGIGLEGWGRVHYLNSVWFLWIHFPETLGVNMYGTLKRASQPSFFIAFLLSFFNGCESFLVSTEKIWYNQLRDQKQKKWAQEYMWSSDSVTMDGVGQSSLHDKTTTGSLWFDVDWIRRALL